MIFAPIRRSTFHVWYWCRILKRNTAMKYLHKRQHTHKPFQTNWFFLLFAVHHFYGDDIFGWNPIDWPEEYLIHGVWFTTHNEKKHYLFGECTNEAGNNCAFSCDLNRFRYLCSARACSRIHSFEYVNVDGRR